MKMQYPHNTLKVVLVVILQVCVSPVWLTKPLCVPSSNDVTKDCQTFTPQCGRVVSNYRFDCHPEPNANEADCISRGCCWDVKTRSHYQPVSKIDIGVPACYFPTNYPGYTVTKHTAVPRGYDVWLQKNFTSWFPRDVLQLKAEFRCYSRNIYRVKIFDPAKPRYEVPIDIPAPRDSFSLFQTNLFVDPFSFTLLDADIIPFDLNIAGAPLIFTDQLIQFSMRLSTPLLYGLGEHKEDLLINASQGFTQKTFWAHDQGPEFNNNLYGVHPFFIQTINQWVDGGEYFAHKSYGFFILNSNAQEVILQPIPAFTYRTIGGILDLFFIVGNTPDDVISSYTSIIGRPYMPPYWALGFHLCRWGYQNATRLKAIIDRNRAIGLPYEAQWTDIDYMDSYRDWTYDTNNFKELPEIVRDLHQHGQRYVIIVDPGISNQSPDYTPYTDGLSQNAFITNYTGKPVEGKVWPGSTVFPDFSNPNSSVWWFNLVKKFHQQLPFDGLWTDMNEPSNFVSGTWKGCIDKNNLDFPPYVPGIVGGTLFANTLCPSSDQYLTSHYNLHNLFGHLEMKATIQALEKVVGQRSLVISRSTFSGSGQYGGHWSGDISSTWEDLRYSIPEMIEFNLFGIPLIGADICGFARDTSYELCVRWIQLGAFYPFSRNHNTIGTVDQDPGSFDSTAQAMMRSALQLRYTFLPHLYTLFYHSHINGTAVVKPLAHVCPYTGDDIYSIQEQFFWGQELLVSPVVYQGARTVRAYFCNNTDFYDVLDNTSMMTGDGHWHDLSAPLDTIRLHLRQGSVVITQKPEVTTELARKNNFSILVTLPCVSRGPQVRCQATGQLYWDNGTSLDAGVSKKFNYIEFCSKNDTLFISPTVSLYPVPMVVEKLVIYGVAFPPTTALVHTHRVTTAASVHSQVIEGKCHVVTICGLTVDLKQPSSIRWMP